MKILHIVGSFQNGGIETLLTNVVNRQSCNGDDVGVIFLTNNLSKELIGQINNSVKKYYINKPVGSKNPYYLLKLNHYYRSFGADVLHLHGSNFTSFLLGKPKNERRFVTLHNNVIKIHYSSSVDQYIAISECVRDSYIRQSGKNNCTICYNGITIERFVCKNEYPAKPFKIVCVGRVRFDVKGQDIIIDALAKLKTKGYPFKCDIYGNGIDYDKLKKLIEDYNLQEYVQLMGDTSNEYIAKHIHEYDIAIQASRHEGLGISAIETMACGVPTILSAVDGFLEVSRNGEYATLFTNGSSIELCQKIENAIDNYSSYVSMAKKAKEYVNNTFSITKMVEELNTIYKIKTDIL